MASDYGKDMYRQLMELFAKVDALTATIDEMKKESQRIQWAKEKREKARRTGGAQRNHSDQKGSRGYDCVWKMQTRRKNHGRSGKRKAYGEV